MKTYGRLYRLNLENCPWVSHKDRKENNDQLLILIGIIRVFVAIE